MPSSRNARNRSGAFQPAFSRLISKFAPELEQPAAPQARGHHAADHLGGEFFDIDRARATAVAVCLVGRCLRTWKRGRSSTGWAEEQVHQPDDFLLHPSRLVIGVAIRPQPEPSRLGSVDSIDLPQRVDRAFDERSLALVLGFHRIKPPHHELLELGGIFLRQEHGLCGHAMFECVPARPSLTVFRLGPGALSSVLDRRCDLRG